MVAGVLAPAGTRKGLFLLWGDDDRRGWRVEGPLLDGWGVYHATVEGRDGTFYAAANHFAYGPTVQRSADGGKTWKRSKKIVLPEWSRLTMHAAWHIEPGLRQQPGTLYLGADPGILFRSDDAGEPGNRTVAFWSTQSASAQDELMLSVWSLPELVEAAARCGRAVPAGSAPGSLWRCRPSAPSRSRGVGPEGARAIGDRRVDERDAGVQRCPQRRLSALGWVRTTRAARVAGGVSLTAMAPRPARSVREKIGERFRPYYKVTDMNTAGAADVTPDAKGDVVLAAQPGQRVQNPRIGGS
jgi:hypothetical protein